MTLVCLEGKLQSVQIWYCPSWTKLAPRTSNNRGGCPAAERMSSGKMSSKIGVYVINLKRRPDRLRDISVALKSSGFEFQRIEAVDGQSRTESESSKLISAYAQACWESHIKALEAFLKSGLRHALILEDDADVSLINEKELVQHTLLMDEQKIALLQVGFVSHFYKFPHLINLLKSVAALREGRVFRSALTTIVYGEFRAGTHAYLVSQEAARALKTANVPVFLPADGFYSALSSYNGKNGEIKFARLSRSRCGQVSRVSGNTNIDSDIEQSSS